MTEKKISLTNIGDGAAVEMFDEALGKILENILDINTDAKTKRVITLKMTISPAENRDCSAIGIEVVPKFAPDKAFETQALMGRDEHTGMAKMAEYSNRKLFDDDGGPVNVETKMRAVK